uniref:BRCA1-associated ATM activator 1-like isoform X1 n=1 Tax=Petromyzon marinus TaxID=7757 RepID=A0AAJ7THJ5_PETMA|nr:BRCA1-associated ATM activator 1-like isoform X1 [Petromyzon marinus]
MERGRTAAAGRPWRRCGRTCGPAGRADAWASGRRARCRRCWTFTWRCCCGAASLPQASFTYRRCCRRCWNRGTRGTGCRSPPLCRSCLARSGTQPRRTFTRCCCLCSPPLRRPARRRPRGPPLPPLPPPSAGAVGVATWALRHMGTRAGAVGLLCHATHLLSQLAGEERPLGRAEATAATEGVCRVVALSLGLDVPQSPTGGRLALFLIGCSRVQRVGLDCLAALAAPTEGEDALGRAVVKVLLGCLGSPDADPSVIAKAFRALQRWLEPERDPVWLTSDTEDALVRVLALRLEDSRWEVRDSSLEFLAAGVSASPRAAPGSALAPWLARHGLHAGAAWDRLSDAQAYVRASAVAALGAMALGGDGAAWARALATLHLTEDDVLGRLCDVLSGDVECFPRRAACRVLTACLRAGGSLRAPLLALASAPPARTGPAGAALRAAARDPDWEVKVNALEFWEAAATLLAREPVGPAAGGPAPALAVLVAALRDCDRPAASKACAALMALADAGVLPRRGGAGGAGGDAEDGGDASADATDDLRRLDLPALRDELERRSDYVQSGPASLLRDILASSDGALLDGADCY